MKTKLLVLVCIGFLLLLTPIIYIPTVAMKIVIAASGIVVMYLTWRIAIAYRRALLASRTSIVVEEKETIITNE
jgi:hypothetical protein